MGFIPGMQGWFNTHKTINKRKNKNHIILSTDAEKAFDRIQHPFLIKTSECRDRGNIPQHLKSHLQKAHSKYHSQWGSTGSLSLKIRKRQGCPLSPLLFNIVLEVLASAIRQQKEIKGIQIGKEEVKLSPLCR